MNGVPTAFRRSAAGLRQQPSYGNMHRVSVKEMVSSAIHRLPDDATLDDIRREIEFIAGVRAGLEQLDRGEGVPLEEVKRQLPQWLAK